MFQRIGLFIPTAGLKETILRFPLSVICCVILFLYFEINNVDKISNGAGSVIGISMILGYFWFGAAALIAESKKLTFLHGAILSVGGYFSLLLIVFSSGSPLESFGLIISALLLLIMVAPFLDRNRHDEILWAYNRYLWAGVITSIAAGLALCVGLSLAVFSMQYLFGLKIAGAIPLVFSFTSILFTPVFALFWVPRSEVLGKADFEMECRILLYWVLMPLILLYFLILYVYAIQILIAWELPRGRLSTMIAGFGALGIATYLVAWPVRETKTMFLQLFHRHFFKLMIVPIVLMVVAISIRIRDYGITEDRYMVLLLLIWFAATAALYIRVKAPALKWIPAILAMLLFIGSFGPWGSAALSGKSQIGRLNALLERHNIIVDGHIAPTVNEIPFEDEKSISSIVTYLAKTNRLKDAHPDFPEVTSKSRRSVTKDVMEKMGLKIIHPSQKAPDLSLGKNFTIQALSKGHEIGNIRGYDFILANISVRLNKDAQWNKVIPADIEENIPEITLSYESGKMLVGAGAGRTLTFDVALFAEERLRKGLPLVGREFILDEVSGSMKGRMFIYHVRGKQKENFLLIEQISFRLLLTI